MKSGWTTVTLSEIVEPAGRRAGGNTDYPVYSVTKHRGFVPSREYFSKQVYGRDLSAYKFVEPDDFAYATIHLDEGSIGIAPESALISPMYTAFRPIRSKVDPGFLLRYLKSESTLKAYAAMGTGSVHRRRSISLSVLGKLRVPLPPLHEQRSIAAALDYVDTLYAKRRRALDLARALRSSIFFSMFGNPLDPRNPIPRASIGEVGRVVTGNSPSRAESAN